MIRKGKIPWEEGFLRVFHASERGLGSFWGFQKRLCALNLQMSKSCEENGSIYIGDDFSY